MKGEGLLNIFLTKPRENAEEMLETYDLFIYGNGPFCKKVIKMSIPNHRS